ncbi:MAG: hypothetical protein RLZZ299_600 [Pseudomonadota bacterium]
MPGNTPLVFTLSTADPGAVIETTLDGARTTSEDGLRLTWTPTRPLDPLLQASVTLRTCAGASTIAWTTAAYGGPLESGVDLGGTGFSIDLARGRIVRPETAQALLGYFRDSDTALLVGMDELAPGQLAYRFATTVDGAQNLCSRTLDVRGGVLDRGWFRFGPADTDFYVFDSRVEVHDLSFGGALLPDGSGVRAAWLEGWVGVEALATAYADGDIDQACAFFGDLGAPCAPCPDGLGRCLSLRIEALEGSATRAPVEAVTEACPTEP